MNARIRRILMTASIILVVLLLAGATYQGVATALERREYPHPGQLIDVGGHQLHIYCLGQGSPTVVLEAPATGMSAAWGWIQPEVARVTRVCSYDRAGLGWSEAGDRRFDPGRVPEELHALLAAAQEQGPYLLVGHSLGAAFARLFASRYPADTAGLVSIDPAREDEAREPGLFALSPWLARAGVLRATGLLSGSAHGLPQRDAGAVRAFLNRPDHLTRAARELTRWDDAVRMAADARVPGSVSHATVQLSDDRRLALITDQDAASRVRVAISRMVAQIRSRAS